MGLHQALNNKAAAAGITLDNLNWLALLFQTGYLTIKDYDPETRLYTLSYPNLEVRGTMYQHLLTAFRGTANTNDHSTILLPISIGGEDRKEQL